MSLNDEQENFRVGVDLVYTRLGDLNHGGHIDMDFERERERLGNLKREKGKRRRF